MLTQGKKTRFKQNYYNKLSKKGIWMGPGRTSGGNLQMFEAEKPSSVFISKSEMKKMSFEHLLPILVNGKLRQRALILKGPAAIKGEIVVDAHFARKLCE